MLASSHRERLARPWIRAAVELSPFTLLFVAVLLLPVGVFVSYSFRPSSTFLGVGSGFTLQHYRDVLSSSADRIFIFRTLAIGLGVGSLVSGLGFVLAYALAFRLGRRGGLVGLGIVIASSLSSLLVRIYAWGTILGTGGLINRTLQSIGLTHGPLGFLFFGYFAIVLTMVYVYLPIGTLIVYSSLQGISHDTLEASRDLGAGRWRTAIQVVAAQGRVGIFGALFFGAIVASADYITPSLVGGVRGQTIGTIIRDLALTDGNYPAAAALSVIFGITLILTLGVFVGVWKLTRGVRFFLGRAVDAVGARTRRVALGRVASVSLSRPASILLLFYLVVPTLTVLAFSFNSGTTVGLPWQGFTTSWYPRLLHASGFSEAVSASVRILSVAVVGGLLVGMPLAMLLAQRGSRKKQGLWTLVIAPLIVPGVLWGAAIVTAAVDQGIPLGITTTSAVHVLLVVPLIVVVVYVRLIELDPALLDAARDLGARPFRAWRTITLPLLLPSLIGAALFAAAYSLDELFVTTFTIGSDATIPVWLFSQARVGFTPAINALGVMLLGTTLLLFALLSLLFAGRRSLGPRRGAGLIEAK